MQVDYEFKLCKEMTDVFGTPRLLKEIMLDDNTHYVADFPEMLRPAMDIQMVSQTKIPTLMRAVTYYIRGVIDAEEIDCIIEGNTLMIKYKENDKFILTEFRADTECWYTSLQITLLDNETTWSQGPKVPCNILNVDYIFDAIANGKIRKVQPKKSFFKKHKKNK